MKTTITFESSDDGEDPVTTVNAYRAAYLAYIEWKEEVRREIKYNDKLSAPEIDILDDWANKLERLFTEKCQPLP